MFFCRDQHKGNDDHVKISGVVVWHLVCVITLGILRS